MIGISWRREQGPKDALLRHMQDELGMEDIPQWNKGNDVRMQANREWSALVPDRDGPVAPERCLIEDVAVVTTEIKAKAVALGADVVGCCGLTPVIRYNRPRSGSPAVIGPLRSRLTRL